MEPNFCKIDLQTWGRGQIFYYFSQMAPTGYSITVEMDITSMKQALKQQNLKFFPAYLWLTTTVLNQYPEFKVAELDGSLGYWDSLTPLYATFHEDDKTFSLMWTEYMTSFHEFYRAYMENKQLYGGNHGILARPDCLPPENCFILSALPWLEFKSFSLHTYENKKYYFPSIEAGRYVEKDGRLMMPLSITVHHATTDGWHIKCFVEELQQRMNEPDSWIFQ